MRKHEADQSPTRLDKRIHAALPVRLTYWDKDMKPKSALACTYDISAHGARVTLLPGISSVGEILAIEHGCSQICCRVVWIADNGSQKRGQMGIQCVDPDARLWDAELGYMQEQYDPLVNSFARMSVRGSANGERRMHQRVPVEGMAELLRHGADTGSIQGELKDLSRFGCLVAPKGPMVPGTDLTLSLNVANYDLKLKGRVLHASALALGIEFREIRKGDRQLLEHLLGKLEGQAPAIKPAPTGLQAKSARSGQ